MRTDLKILWLTALCCASHLASAEDPPAAKPAAVTTPKATAQSEAGEPRAAIADAGPAPAVTDKSAKSKPPKSKVPGAADKLELSTATVTGDREQPKVMYIVPWKRADMGDLEGKPMNSLVDEILAPVDRDVFKREVTYYQAVQSDSQTETSAKPTPQGEK